MKDNLTVIANTRNKAATKIQTLFKINRDRKIVQRRREALASTNKHKAYKQFAETFENVVTTSLLSTGIDTIIDYCEITAREDSAARQIQSFVR
jgi:hypothetical protein